MANLNGRLAKLEAQQARFTPLPVPNRVEVIQRFSDGHERLLATWYTEKPAARIVVVYDGSEYGTR